MSSLPSQRPRSRSTPSSQAPQFGEATMSTPAQAQQNSNSSTLPISAATSQAQANSTAQEPTSEPRRCWICQCDATEDTPTSSPWRSPCPCSLQAHEDCLLEWYDSSQAPKPGQLSPPSKMECPVCKAEIFVDRPRHLVVIVVEKVQKMAMFMVLPTAAGMVGGLVHSGLMMYGMNTLHLVFGAKHAASIMGASSTTAAGYSNLKRFKGLARVMLPFMPSVGFVNFRVWAGLPLIAPSLILFRTKLGDYVCAALPIAYFAHRQIHTTSLDALHYPPSPAQAFFAVLPFLRTVYNTIYEQAFSSLEKSWDLAVQRKPREGETAEQIAAEAARGDGDGEAIFDFELEIVGEEVEEGDDNNANLEAQGQQVQGAAARIPDQAAPALGRQENNIPAVGEQNQNPDQGQPQAQQNNADADANPNPNVANAQPNQANAGEAAAGGGWEVRQNISTAHVASTVMGALFFPAISSLMGDLLIRTLPEHWVSRSSKVQGGNGFDMNWFWEVLGLGGLGGGGKEGGGLLKQKWGRTLVGGCAFVVLKDVVILYCKWRKARDWGRRRVRDYVR